LRRRSVPVPSFIHRRGPAEGWAGVIRERSELKTASSARRLLTQPEPEHGADPSSFRATEFLPWSTVEIRSVKTLHSPA
jgi:hypothetical protein